MKIAIITLLLLFSCGKKDKKNTVPGPQGPSCSVTQLANAAKITCPDGSIATVQNGASGVNGASCSVEQLINGSKIQCTDGTYATVLNGDNGSSCSVTGTSVGADILCEDGTSVSVNNGLSGQNCVLEDLVNGIKITCGLNSAVVYDGTSVYSVTQIIDVCGDDPGEFDEVILKLQNGSLMAHYSHGNDQFLTLLEPNRSYVTTDRSSCPFFVDANYNITW